MASVFILSQFFILKNKLAGTNKQTFWDEINAVKAHTFCYNLLAQRDFFHSPHLYKESFGYIYRLLTKG
jgi:hypothetical protein